MVLPFDYYLQLQQRELPEAKGKTKLAMLKWVICYSPFGIKRPREARTARAIGSLAYNAFSVASSSGMPECSCHSANSRPRGQKLSLLVIAKWTPTTLRQACWSEQVPDQIQRTEFIVKAYLCTIGKTEKHLRGMYRYNEKDFSLKEFHFTKGKYQRNTCQHIAEFLNPLVEADNCLWKVLFCHFLDHGFHFC